MWRIRRICLSVPPAASRPWIAAKPTIFLPQRLGALACRMDGAAHRTKSPRDIYRICRLHILSHSAIVDLSPASGELLATLQKSCGDGAPSLRVTAWCRCGAAWFQALPFSASPRSCAASHSPGPEAIRGRGDNPSVRWKNWRNINLIISNSWHVMSPFGIVEWSSLPLCPIEWGRISYTQRTSRPDFINLHKQFLKSTPMTRFDQWSWVTNWWKKETEATYHLLEVWVCILIHTACPFNVLKHAKHRIPIISRHPVYWVYWSGGKRTPLSFSAKSEIR